MWYHGNIMLISSYLNMFQLMAKATFLILVFFFFKFKFIIEYYILFQLYMKGPKMIFYDFIYQ